MVTVFVSEHPLLSVNVTLYVPEGRDEKILDACSGPQFKENWYGVLPPPAAAVMLPSEAELQLTFTGVKFKVSAGACTMVFTTVVIQPAASFTVTV